MSGHAHLPHLDAIEHGYAKKAHENFGVPMPKDDHGHGHGGGHGHDDHGGHGGHDAHGSSGGFGNRVGNLVATPVRLAGTVGYAGLDLAKTLVVEPVKNVAQITSDSVDDVSKLFQEAGKRGKWYHKALNLPLAGALSGVKAVEWACRSVLNTGWNAAANTFNTVKGGVKNVFNTVTSVFSKKPISDFSFDHLKTKSTWKTFDLSKFLVGGNSGGGHDDHGGHGGHDAHDSHAVHAPDHVPLPAHPEPHATHDVVDLSAIENTINQQNNTIAQLSQQVAAQDKKNAELQQALLQSNASMTNELGEIKKLLAGALGGKASEEAKKPTKEESKHDHKEEKKDHKEEKKKEEHHPEPAPH